MKRFLFVAIFLLVAVVSGYFALSQREQSLGVDDTQTAKISADISNTTLGSASSSLPAPESVAANQAGSQDYAGTHIMPDGSIMDAQGKPIAGAKIQADGKILFSNGVTVTPAFDQRPASAASQKPSTHKVFDIVGTDFQYDIKEIRVKKGDTVTINFRSNQGFHDWVLDEFAAATKRVNEGELTSVTFVADKVGTFQYYCSVMNHRALGMIGYIIVEE